MGFARHVEKILECKKKEKEYKEAVRKRGGKGGEKKGIRRGQ